MSAADIPDHLAAYVDVLGPDDAAVFLLAFGGAPIYLAANPKGRSLVAGVIGPEKARALALRIGPGHVRVPNGKKWIARHLRAKGDGVFEIARRLHVSDATVRAYLKDGDDRQGRLFG